MELAGRVALITGGRRIGAAVAIELARGGADIALVYRRSRAEAEETADSLRALGRRAFLVQADLSSPESCERVVDETVDALGRLDVLVNMASIYVSKPIDEVTVDDWNTQIAVDLTAAWLCARAAVPHMRRLRGGRIVNFSDWVARSGRPRYTGYLTYYVAKAGVIALTEALALELAKREITVNCVAPGLIETELIREAPLDEILKLIPARRIGRPDEVAAAVSFLLTEDAAYITRQVISVNGGLI